MLQLEIVVVVVSLRPEPDFLNFLLNLLRLQFLGTLFLLVKELAVVDETANGRLRIRRYLYEIHSLAACHVQCLACWYYCRTVIAYDADFFYANLLIHAVIILFVVLHQLFLRMFYENRLQSYYKSANQQNFYLNKLRIKS